MKDILPIYFVAAVSAFCAYTMTFVNINNLLQLVFAVSLAAVVYIVSAYFFKFEIISETKNLFYILKNKYLSKRI